MEIVSSKKALAFAGVLLVLLRKLWQEWRSYPRNCNLASPGILGTLGGLPMFIRSIMKALRYQNHDYQWELCQQNGGTVAMKTPLNKWWLFTSNLANLEHIYKKNFDNYPKGKFFTDPSKELLGNGIFNTDGPNWKYQRKTASQMFTRRLFEEHIWVVVERNGKKLRELLQIARDDGSQVDVFNLMNRFTLDTIGEIGFARSIGSLEDPSSPFLKSFDRAQQITFWRFMIKAWPIVRALKILWESDSSQHNKLLNDYSYDVVKDLREKITAGQDCEAMKSFVGLFMQDAIKSGTELSDVFLRDLVLNFLIAGRDTTAQALSWTIFELTRHPEVQQKVREEVDAVCGDTDLRYEDISKLTYTQAVLHEGLRLYPSVPLEVKETLQDDTLPDGTWVAQGTVIAPTNYGIGRDTSIWGADAAEFRPERWLEMDKNPDNFKFPVFHAGPRECLGRRLALVEMKACLAMLLPHMSFQLAVPAESIKPDTQLTLGMSSGLPCRILSPQQ